METAKPIGSKLYFGRKAATPILPFVEPSDVGASGGSIIDVSYIPPTSSNSTLSHARFPFKGILL